MKYFIIIPLIIIIIIYIRIKRRKFFWRDKQGKELSFKEFISRWKDGVEGITPLQQTKTQMMGTWISITGILAGIVVNALIRLKNVWWWLEIILIGSLIITSVSMIGMYQKYLMQKKSEELMKEAMKRSKKKSKKK